MVKIKRYSVDRTLEKEPVEKVFSDLIPKGKYEMPDMKKFYQEAYKKYKKTFDDLAK